MAARRSESNPVGIILLILGLVLGIPLLLLIMCGIGFFIMTVMAGRAALQVAEEVEMPPPKIVIDQANDPFRNKGFPGADPFEQGQPVPNPPPQPPPPKGVPGKTMVDLIPLIKPEVDTVHGRWLVQNNILHCSDAHFVPRIQIPYQPPKEYDFVVVFSQPGLRNGISLIMPNPTGGSFFWFVGSENGSAYGMHGTPIKEGRAPGLVKVNTICTTVVQVRANSVKGLVDGKLLINRPTDFRDLTSDNWREMRDNTILGVACDDPTVFHHVRLIEITGKGRKTR